MKKILIGLLVLGCMFLSFILGIGTAFKYPQECYDLFIDKSYPCKIIKLNKGE
jgi:hypothetical protein